MFAEKFLNTVRMQANLATSTLKNSSIGVITGVDLGNYLVTAQLLDATDDDPAIQTGWIPILSPWVGSGWGMFCPPSTGDLCDIHFQEGNLNNAYASLRVSATTANQSPAQSGEFWLVHQTGAIIKLTNDGITIDAASMKLSLQSSNEIDINAPIVNINSPSITLGNGVLTPLLKSDDTPTVNVKAS